MRAQQVVSELAKPRVSSVRQLDPRKQDVVLAVRHELLDGTLGRDGGGSRWSCLCADPQLQLVGDARDGGEIVTFSLSEGRDRPPEVAAG